MIMVNIRTAVTGRDTATVTGRIVAVLTELETELEIFVLKLGSFCSGVPGVLVDI